MDKDKHIADLELQLTNCRDTFNAYQVDYKILKQHLEEAQAAYVSAYDTGYMNGMKRAAEIAAAEFQWDKPSGTIGRQIAKAIREETEK